MKCHHTKVLVAYENFELFNFTVGTFPEYIIGVNAADDCVVISVPDRLSWHFVFGVDHAIRMLRNKINN